VAFWTLAQHRDFVLVNYFAQFAVGIFELSGDFLKGENFVVIHNDRPFVERTMDTI